MVYLRILKKRLEYPGNSVLEDTSTERIRFRSSILIVLW